mgnify:FL=1
MILSSLAEKPIELGLAGKVFLSVVIVVLGCFVVGYVIVKLLGLSIKLYLPPIMFANTGNMGLPLVLFAFGDNGFSIGILYMVSMTIIHYTLGILILNFDKSPFEVLKLPLVYSAILGILLSVSGWKMPLSAERAVTLLGEASIPTMIFALGYKLSELRLSHVKISLLFGGLRIALGFTLGILTVTLFGLNGVTSDTIILQSAMPPAVFNFVLAGKYNQDSHIVASIIMAGTLISVFTTPLIIAWLI